MQYNDDEFVQTDVNSFIKSKSSDLMDHHNKVQDYWRPFNDKAEFLITFSQGGQYTPEEEKIYQEKRKLSVVLNKIKSSERRILGHFSAQMFDIEFTSMDRDGEELTEILEKLYIWERGKQNVKYLDVDMLRQAWITGSAIQESYVDIQPYRDPVIRTSNRNRYAVYWDPNSREPITRDDAEFVDLISYESLEGLVRAFPDKEEILRERLSSYSRIQQGYESEDDPLNDRDIENQDEKNGRFRVLERYIRKRKTTYRAFDREAQAFIEWGEDENKEMRSMFDPRQIEVDSGEELWLIVALDSSFTEDYLYNGPYHAQPIHPYTRKIMWPFVEFACETINGFTYGFVEHEVGVQKIINSMMSNIVDSARNSSGAGKLFVEQAFKDQKTANDFARYGADSNRNFSVKDGYLDRATSPIPKSQVNQDNHNALAYAEKTFDEISSTPPSTQGIQAGSESGVLNQQRIEQALSQILPFIENYRRACVRRAELWCAYWKEFYTDKKVFKITGEDGQDQEFVLNEKFVDELGQIKKRHDLDFINHEIGMKDSNSSPTYRAKTQQTLAQIIQSGAVQSDPVLTARLTAEFVAVSDLPHEAKQFILAHSERLKENKNAELNQELQAQQQQLEAIKQEIENLKKMGEQEKKNLEGEYSKTIAGLEMQSAKLESQIADQTMELAENMVGDQISDEISLIEDQQRQDFAKM